MFFDELFLWPSILPHREPEFVWLTQAKHIASRRIIMNNFSLLWPAETGIVPSRDPSHTPCSQFIHLPPKLINFKKLHFYKLKHLCAFLNAGSPGCGPLDTGVWAVWVFLEKGTQSITHYKVLGQYSLTSYSPLELCDRLAAGATEQKLVPFLKLRFQPKAPINADFYTFDTICQVWYHED